MSKKRITHKCPNCDHAFNMEEWIYKAKPEDLTYLEKPNTLTGLADRNEARIRCPACRQFILNSDYPPMERATE